MSASFSRRDALKALAAAAAAPHLVVFDPGQPTAGETLGEFFLRWYEPQVPDHPRRPASQATRLIYRDALRWWSLLAGDPPIDAIDDAAVDNFFARLATATYRRGRLGASRTLAATTQHKIGRTIRALLYRVGPRLDRAKPTAHVVDESPLVVVGPAPATRCKPPFTAAEAAAIVAAAGGLDWGPRPRRAARPLPDMPAGAWWQEVLCAFAYTGLRAGTIFALDWSMLVRRRGHWLFDVRAESKTGKVTAKYVHPDLLDRLLRRRPEPAVGLVFPLPSSYEHFSRRHAALQRAAGLDDEAVQSPHAWRRTYADWMAALGARHAVRLAQHALNHADSFTTEASYLEIERQLVPKLPKLLPAASSDDGQQRLF